MILVQEMSLAVLEYDQKASTSSSIELATNRAKDYLKYEACRGMVPLSEARTVSDSVAEKMASLNAFIDKLMAAECRPNGSRRCWASG